MAQRVSSLRQAVQKAGVGKKAALPVAYIENSSGCATKSTFSHGFPCFMDGCELSVSA